MNEEKDLNQEASVAVEKKTSLLGYYEENAKAINISLIVLIVALAGYMGYTKFWMPKVEAEAQTELFMAQRYFGQDSFDLALNGDGSYLGVIDIADQYGNTKAGNLAKFYAGRSYMAKEQYTEAIGYLEKVKFNDDVLPGLVKTLLGDCHVQMDAYEEAGKVYMQAANAVDNEFSSPYALKKAGLAFTNAEKYDQALAAYQKLYDDYRNTEEGIDAKKLLAEALAKAGQPVQF